MTETNVSERQVIGKAIRALREEHGLSQTEAARRCGIERTYWIDIENGTANVTFEKYERIAAFFEVSVRDLVCASPVTFEQSPVPKQSKPKRRKAS